MAKGSEWDSLRALHRSIRLSHLLALAIRMVYILHLHTRLPAPIGAIFLVICFYACPLRKQQQHQRVSMRMD